ncbi:hypothetical protein [Kitasatospora sp. NPDC057223]|uniref:hypothetical protein n=1 Tax=Kitasatospora sp. NPDC057223 TaxID=3346055 RepID=UPI003634A0BF
MTDAGDRVTVDAICRAADLTRAYLARERAVVEGLLAGVDGGVLDGVLAWLVLDHDDLFAELGEPSMPVRGFDAVAALAPAESQFAVTTAVRRVASGDAGLAAVVEELGRREDQAHAVAICTTVMLLEAVGRTEALRILDEDTAQYIRRGHPRPYTLT